MTGPRPGMAAMRGAAWSLAAQAASKGGTVLGQVAIVGLLAPGDFAAAAMALAVAGAIGLVAPGGLVDAQVAARGRDADQAQWYSLAVTTTAAAGVACAAWSLPGHAELLLQSCCLLLGSTLLGLCTRPVVAMQLALRQRELAAVVALEAPVLWVTTALLAWAGFGAWSIILAHPVRIAATWLQCRHLAPGGSMPAPMPSSWPSIARDALGQAFAGAHAATLPFALPFALAAVLTRDDLGLVLWAVAAAGQGALAIAGAARSALFPVVAQLEPGRIADALRRASDLAATVAISGSALAALAAAPLLAHLGPQRWQPASDLIAPIAVGLSAAVLGQTAIAVWSARQGTLLAGIAGAILAACCVGAAAAGAAAAGPAGAAWGLAGGAAAGGIAAFAAVAHAAGCSVAAILRTAGGCLLLAACALASATLIPGLLDGWPGWLAAALAVTAAAAIVRPSARTTILAHLRRDRGKRP